MTGCTHKYKIFRDLDKKGKLTFYCVYCLQLVCKEKDYSEKKETFVQKILKEK